jgi:endoglycosylceramidase
VAGQGIATRGDAVPDYWPKQRLTIDQTRFRDEHGRQVVLNGINFADLAFDASGKNDQPNRGPVVFPQLRAWGFNCARLPMNWSGIEPEPGKYDEKYLARVDRLVRSAAENGVYVILDMHQDLYGVKHGDGAPAWATFDDDKPHAEGAIWSDSYLLSQAVQTAFDNFWANKPAADGRGIQDHYIAMWQMLARRYAGEPYVLGYDLMNEPFMGSAAQQLLPLFLQQYGKAVAQQTNGPPPTPEQLYQIWADQKARIEGLKLLCTAEHYADMVDAVYDISRRFETGPLQQMYQRLADVIREVDQNHVLFLEHSGFCNIGIRSSIEPVATKLGTPDPLLAYAPHGYDLLTDTKGVAGPSEHRLRLIFSRIQETGLRLKMPVVVGEWGAFPDADPALVAPARQVLGLLESLQLGHTYWLCQEKIGDYPYFQQALVRPSPLLIAGDLTGYGYDPAQKRLEVRWQESAYSGSPTVVYLPEAAGLQESQVVIEPKPQKAIIEKIGGSPAGYLLVYPESGKKSRTLLWQSP